MTEQTAFTDTAEYVEKDGNIYDKFRHTVKTITESTAAAGTAN